ncbi:hypothetical protein PanWU01x14_234580 [Parasponia andersonii]|uniref:Uncharacterized protein n=1 Tax=Parasponia andersonii TaxID=3476 RepID=A0A2P5BIY2_PARAD|nr:hypothetical protein PanWU01x14_234580 [Parasponia andersonii]
MISHRSRTHSNLPPFDTSSMSVQYGPSVPSLLLTFAHKPISFFGFNFNFIFYFFNSHSILPYLFHT